MSPKGLASDLQISFLAHCCLRHQLAEGSIMNSQKIRNLFQSIFLTWVGGKGVHASLYLRRLSADYSTETRLVQILP